MNERKKQGLRIRKKAFTLVEVVAAMAIMLLVALIIGLASTIFYNGYRRSVKNVEMLKDYQRIDILMDQSVRNMIPFFWKNPEEASTADPELVFEGETDSMLFVTKRRAYDTESGALMFIRIRLDDSDLVAEYSFYPRGPWDEPDSIERPFTREILSRNVKSISFLYADSDSSNTLEWVESWGDAQTNSIPLAVQLTVEWNDSSTEQWLRRSSGASSNSYFGRRGTETIGGDTR